MGGVGGRGKEAASLRSRDTPGVTGVKRWRCGEARAFPLPRVKPVMSTVT